MESLGFLYAKGFGVDKSYTAARFWYKKAIQRDGKQANILLNLLNEDEKCHTGNATTLFGVILKCSTIHDLDKAIRSKGLKYAFPPVNALDTYSYSAPGLLPDSTRLYIKYSYIMRFSFAAYSFTNFKLDNFNSIKAELESQYGTSEQFKGNHFIWKTQDGITINLNLESSGEGRLIYSDEKYAETLKNTQKKLDLL